MLDIFWRDKVLETSLRIPKATVNSSPSSDGSL